MFYYDRYWSEWKRPSGVGDSNGKVLGTPHTPHTTRTAKAFVWLILVRMEKALLGDVDSIRMTYGTPCTHIKQEQEDIKTKRNLIIQIYYAYYVFMTKIGPNGKGPRL